MYAVYLALAVLVNQVYSQYIPPCAAEIAPIYAPNCRCGCPAPALVAAPAPAVIAAPAPAVVAAPAPTLATPASLVAPTVVTSNSVATNLADTLSLLTVTSLLAEVLPSSYPAVAPQVGYPSCTAGYGYHL